MNDSKEICLYFDKNTNYNPVDIAKEICDRYKELGNPLILPSQGGNAPVIVFQENPEIFLRCNYFTLNFVVNHTYFNKLESIIFDLVDIFEEYIPMLPLSVSLNLAIVYMVLGLILYS